MFKHIIVKYEENYDTSRLNEGIVNHCNMYTDRFMKDISRFGYAKMLELVKEVFKEDLRDEEIIFEGKPRFATKTNIFFNISHEDNLLAIIVADKECGIDLCRRVTNVKLAEKILSEEEYNEFQASSDKEEYIARKWAMKEAYAKWMGTGLNEKIFKTTVKVRISDVKFGEKNYYLCIKCDD